MRHAPLWQQANQYPAGLDRQLIAALWPSGGVNGAALTLVPNTMDVSVALGSAAVTLTPGQGSALCIWDAPEVVTLPAAPPSGQSRIDLIVVQVRDAAFDGGADNDFILTSVQGAPAASNPATPATPVDALALATVTVPGGAANLNGATVADRRGPLNPRDMLLSRRQMAASFVLDGNTKPIPFDTNVFDPSGLWVPARAGWVVPVAGKYLVHGQWTVTGASVQAYTVALVNNVGIQGHHVNPTPGNFSIAITVIAALVAGDLVQIGGLSFPSIGTQLGGQYNFGEIAYLGSG